MKAVARSSMMGMTLGLEPRSLALSCGPAATDRMDTPRGASRKHAVQLHHVMCCYLEAVLVGLVPVAGPRAMDPLDQLRLLERGQALLDGRVLHADRVGDRFDRRMRQLIRRPPVARELAQDREVQRRE